MLGRRGARVRHWCSPMALNEPPRRRIYVSHRIGSSTFAIREETAGDSRAISAVVVAAFRAHPHSDACESEIVSLLRARGELVLSLVATLGRQVVGHISFSPVTIASRDAGWYGLGPLAVDQSCQGKGIGSCLVRTGLIELVRHRANGCVVFGSADYYQRFGFAVDPLLTYPDRPKENFLALAFARNVPSGVVRYSPAFGGRLTRR